MDEDLPHAVHRELKEETNLEGVNLQQLHTFGAIDRDPRHRTISVVYWGIVAVEKSDVRGGDDAKQAQWFSCENAPGLAFDHHEIFKYAMAKLSSIL